MVQRSFFKNRSEHSANRISHGGADSNGRRKIYRPLNPRKPLHVVLKSSHAKGKLSLLGAAKRLKVEAIVRQQASRAEVTIHEFQNMGNHLHILIAFKTRRGAQAFLRAVTGMISRLATGARKGKAFGKRFWDHLAFSRVIIGHRDSQSMSRYFEKNQIQRENGPALQQAVELYDRITRIAQRRKVSREDIIQEMLEAAEQRPH